MITRSLHVKGPVVAPQAKLGMSSFGHSPVQLVRRGRGGNGPAASGNIRLKNASGIARVGSGPTAATDSIRFPVKLGTTADGRFY